MRNKNRIYNFILCSFLLVFVIVFLSGCRARISDSPEVDEVVSMPEAMAAVQQYEERREDLNLDTATAPLRNKHKEDSTAESPARAPGQRPGKGPGNGSGTDGSGDDGSGGGGGEQEGTVTVNLDPNGGSCETDRVKVIYGKSYGTLPVAARDGYIFSGWFTKAEGGTLISASTTVTLKKGHTLYAHWEKASEKTTYTITFDANGGRISQKYATRTLREGDAYGTFPDVYKGGYKMEGWFTQAEGGTQVYADTIFEGGDQTLYAHWSYDPYTYWSYKLKNTTEQMYSCQVVPCYIEFEDHITASSCSFLSGCKAENVAMNRGSDVEVTDEWVNGKDPKVIIKCTSSGASTAISNMAQRFPGKRILVAPTQAVYGSQNEQLYYTLNLGVLVYPDWFADIDLGKAAEELGVGGRISE